MMRLAWPWAALALPLPWLLYRWRSAVAPGGTALFLPFPVPLDRAASAARSSSVAARCLFAAIWLLVVVAAMRPQWFGDPLPSASSGRRIVLAVDVSGSMATRDMADDASRLQVVREVAGRFIDGRQGDQVGLILFGTQPYVQAPLTTDLDTVHRFLDEAVVGIAGTETAIGDAIGLALKRLLADAAVHGERGPQGARTVLILLTDGQNDAGVLDPLQAAGYASRAGLRIYTIGVGAVPDPSADAARGNDDLDEDALRAIAARTGGQYFRAGDAGALERIYAQIDTLEPSASRERWRRPPAEWYGAPLALALLLSIPAAWAGGRAWL